MVSIIVPIYNVENYLNKCIESLQSQTLKEIEIILVDDGSPDESGKICDDYAEKAARIRVIHQENQGVSAARNAGLAIAKGEYIGFVDPDDWVQPDMYEKLLDAIETTDADLAVAGYNYYDEEYIVDKKRLYPTRENQILDRKEIYKQMSDMPPTMRHGVVQKLFRRDLIGDLRFDTNTKSSEDLEFLLNYLSKVNKAVFIHQPLYNNLVRKGSATHGGLKIQSLRDSLKIHNRMYEDTIKEFPELKDYAIAYLLDVCLLKYNDCKRQLERMAGEMDNKSFKEQERMVKEMRGFIRRMAWTGLRSRHIYWKTRISYLLCR